MLNFKKILCSISVLCFSSGAWASEETGYYTFANYRYFGPALATDNYAHTLDEDNQSVSRFYPNVAKLQYNLFKNTSRAAKNAMGYGDWNKKYRVMSGFEYDYKRNKSSKSNYGYKQDSGSFYLLSDKAFYNGNVRLGGGGIFSKYDGDYTNGLEQREDNAQAVAYVVYNDNEEQLRVLTRTYLGYGTTELKRRSQSGTYKDTSENWYYGLENSVSKIFQKSAVYFQPVAEFNGLGIKRGKINDGLYQMPSNDGFLWYGLVDFYLGIKGTDNYSNHYNLKIGPEFSRVFSDPYDSFYAQDNEKTLSFKARRDKRDYVMWKAYGAYTLSDGLGFFGEFRYYIKNPDSVAYAAGINYRF